MEKLVKSRMWVYLLAGSAVVVLLVAALSLLPEQPATGPAGTIGSTITPESSPSPPPPTTANTATAVPPTEVPPSPSPRPTATPTEMPPTATPTSPPPTARSTGIKGFPFFGVSMNHVTVEYGLVQAQEAGVQAVRDMTIPWNQVEPRRTDPPTYEWQVLEGLEQELITAQKVGLVVSVLVMFTPDWAQAVPGHSCGAIREEELGAFAQFLEAAVGRYSKPPYNVKYWELFNEPDIDPALVDPDCGFGCWGDGNDPFYGGRRYGKMLKAAYPAIKRADPEATVILGGLLLDAPDEAPSPFLAGVLEEGGGDCFDILAFHAYTYYSPAFYNWSTGPNLKWNDWGGIVIGKAAFLRQVLGEYGYEKPLILNEASLGWYPDREPPDDFWLGQADYVVKLHARGLAHGLLNITWFGWRGPGWRRMALLNADLSPTPGYHAYAFARQQLGDAQYLEPTSYQGTEGYAFQRPQDRLLVVWSADGEVYPVSVPAGSFVDAFGVDGGRLSPRQQGDKVVFDVRSPVYIELQP